MGELETWDYVLPAESVARYPAERRDQSRLMVLDRRNGSQKHGTFTDITDWLRPHDLLIANDTRVMAARLYGHRKTGGKVECLILRVDGTRAQGLVRPDKKVKIGEWVDLVGGGRVRCDGRGDAPGQRDLVFEESVHEVMERQGAMPLPPYLGREEEPSDRDRYQTIFAGPTGASAAPTAGLHFTREVLSELQSKKIAFETITLHVGLGTFRPLTDADVSRGRLHRESYVVSSAVRKAIASARARNGRVIAVGTTSLRTLEAATPLGSDLPNVGAGNTDIFIRPPYDFRCAQGLLTNFHLPKSSLLMLVGALVGQKELLAAYEAAVEKGYRFYSYGDAMLLI